MSDELLRMPLRDLEQALHPIWGLKLGPPASNEARTSIWVHSAGSTGKQ